MRVSSTRLRRAIGADALRRAVASRVGLALAFGWLLLVAAESRAADNRPTLVNVPFARVGDVVITQKEFDDAFAVAARNKFYHGKPPEADVAKLQREVGDGLVNDVLLVREAERRKIKPDATAVKSQIDGYESRYRTSEMWQKNKATMLPGLTRKLEHDSLLEQLRATVRAVPEPGEAQLRNYYEQHKDKFTEPEQVKLSLILLKVDPSSPQTQWNAAMAEAQAIVKRLRGGADFAQLAHLHSGDASAAKGGAIDYVHRGMLPDAAQAAIDKLQPGVVSDPVVLLEGVAVLRLEGRKPARLNALPVVRQRAHDLLVRELADKAWSDLIASLRRQTPPQIDTSRYLPLALAKAPQASAAQAR